VIGREKAVEREIVLPFPSEPAVVEIRLEW
jgi:hypothetical protein